MPYSKIGSEVRLADFRAQFEKNADFNLTGQSRWGDVSAVAQVSGPEMSSVATRQEGALQYELSALEELSLSLGNHSAAARSEDQNASHHSATGSELSPPAVPALGSALEVGAGAAEPQNALQSSSAEPALRLCASPVFVNLLGSINTVCDIAAGGQGLQRFWARFAAALGRKSESRPQSQQMEIRKTSSGRRWWEAQDRSWWEQRDAPWWKQQVDPWWKPQAGKWWE